MQNSTSNTNQTNNPQDAAPSAGASNGADFQQTASPDILEDNTQGLGVEDVSVQPSPAGTSLDWTPWLIGLGIVVLLAALVMIVRMLMDETEEPASPAPKQAAAKKPSATAKKKPVKSKSGKPVKHSRKPARKRR